MVTQLAGRARRWLPVAMALGLLACMATGAYAADADAPKMTAQTLIFHILDWIVIVVLIAASITGVALAIDAVINIRESKIAPPETTDQLKGMIAARQFKELLEFTAGDTSFVSQTLHAALRRAHLGYAAMGEALESAVSEQTAALFRRIEMLNVIGNIGPLIGLLGTVLGMIIAFYELNAAGGNAKPAQLAFGIATALWHTFGGLFVAIPCLVMFGLYRTRVDRITLKAALTAEELLESLRPTEKGGAVLGGETHVKEPLRRPVMPAAAGTAS